MENPYRRLRQLTKYSQKDFGEKFQFSKTTLIYMEQGQYPELSDDMILSLGQACVERGVDAKQVLFDEYNSEDLQSAYSTWQATERMKVAHMFQKSPPKAIIGSPESPFKWYMEETAGTRHNFCKTLKVPPAAALRYATGATRTMPKTIEAAFKSVSFPYLTELKEEQEKWVSQSS